MAQLRLRDRVPPLQVALHELHRDQFVHCPLTKHEQDFGQKKKKKNQENYDNDPMLLQSMDSSRCHNTTTNLELNFELCRRYQNRSTQVLDNNSNRDHIWHSLVQRSDPSDSPRSPGLRRFGIP